MHDSPGGAGLGEFRTITGLYTFGGKLYAGDVVGLWEVDINDTEHPTLVGSWSQDVQNNSGLFGAATVPSTIQQNLPVTLTGSGVLSVPFSDNANFRQLYLARLTGGLDDGFKTGTGWAFYRDGTANLDAAYIRGVLGAAHIDSDVINVQILSIIPGTLQTAGTAFELLRPVVGFDTLMFTRPGNQTAFVPFETIGGTHTFDGIRITAVSSDNRTITVAGSGDVSHIIGLRYP